MGEERAFGERDGAHWPRVCAKRGVPHDVANPFLCDKGQVSAESLHQCSAHPFQDKRSLQSDAAAEKNALRRYREQKSAAKLGNVGRNMTPNRMMVRRLGRFTL